jgi:hypothetical protein
MGRTRSDIVKRDKVGLYVTGAISGVFVVIALKAIVIMAHP